MHVVSCALLLLFKNKSLTTEQYREQKAQSSIYVPGNQPCFAAQTTGCFITLILLTSQFYEVYL